MYKFLVFVKLILGVFYDRIKNNYLEFEKSLHLEIYYFFYYRKWEVPEEQVREILLIFFISMLAITIYAACREIYDICLGLYEDLLNYQFVHKLFNKHLLTVDIKFHADLTKYFKENLHIYLKYMYMDLTGKQIRELLINDWIQYEQILKNDWKYTDIWII